MKKILLFLSCVWGLYLTTGAQNLSPNSLAIVEQDTSYLVAVNTHHYFSGYMTSYGPNTITSINIDYSVNGGPTIVYPLNSLSVAPYTDENYTVTPAWTPSATGTYNVKIWLDAINGPYTNALPSLDTAFETYLVVDSIVPKKVLLETFTQASCGACFADAPYIDPIMQTASQMSLCNSARYHVNWPGVDYMNNVTQGPFIGTRVGYYGVSGVPDFKIDGAEYPPSYDVLNVQQAQQIGSPFRINIIAFSFDSLTNTYSAQATVKSFGSFPAGLSVRAVLTVDTIKYAVDQSTDAPTSSFAPPIGSGGNSDNTYTYVTNFPSVAEAMLPSAVGSTLGTLVPETTKTLTFSWTKNHPWGINPSVNLYDSTSPGVNLTVFVQTDVALGAVAAKYVYQSASKDIPSTLPTSVNTVKTDNLQFHLFPNPTNNLINVVFNLNTNQSISLDIYDMLGENVMEVNENEMTAGQHSISLNCSGLKQGVYFLKISSKTSLSVQKLVIER